MMVTKYKRSILFYSIVLRLDNIFTKKFEGTWPSGHDNPKHLFFFFYWFSSFYLMILSRDGHSVLVHGFEGTDSTLLISTLAQLIMDPCCRTLEGFLALLEREWVQVSVHGNTGRTVCLARFQRRQSWVIAQVSGSQRGESHVSRAEFYFPIW